MTRAKTKKISDLRLLTALGLFLIVSGLGATQIVSATNAQLAGVERDASATSALSASSAGFENYLLVGSDSREGVDPYSRVAAVAAGAESADQSHNFR